MQITDMLTRTGGLKSIARELGLKEIHAANGAAALLPAILGGFKKLAESDPGGVGGLGGMLDQLGGGALLDDLLALKPTDVSRGNHVLGVIFGSKEVSRAVAQKAAARTGLSRDLLEQMLPMLAMLVTGFMAKQQAAHAAQPATARGAFSEVLATLGSRIAAGANPIPDVAPGLAEMLELDGDGNPLDDVLETAGKAMP